LLDERSVSRLIVAIMNKKIFTVLAGVAIIVTGCVGTVTDTSTFAMSPSKDSVAGRYNRTVAQVYDASKNVLQRDGVLLTEYVPHDYTNEVRSMEGRVSNRKVFIRVQSIDPKITQVDVQARTTMGGVDLDLVHQIEKEIALELAAH
jgi:hypothetical protein